MVSAQPGDKEHTLEPSAEILRAERQLESATIRRTEYFRRKTRQAADVRGRSRQCEHWLTAVARDSLVAVLAASPGRTANPLPAPRLGTR